MRRRGALLELPGADKPFGALPIEDHEVGAALGNVADFLHDDDGRTAIQLALGRAALFLPPLAAGVWLGNRSFRGADPAVFRRWVLRLLMLLAVLTGGRALLEIL